MNVIIRLQNLPWSANASDIRSFFKNLQIPEGGVHIVGGENGDAFIAFSTDEDARQAMQMNGGKLKEVQVSLLLSSRAEMQKVIEKARQASTTSFMGVPAIQQTSIMPAADIANKFAKKMPEIPQPPAISLTNFLTQNMAQQQMPTVTQAQQQLNMMSGYKTNMRAVNMPGISGLQAAIAPDTAAAYASYYATLLDQNALNYVNPMVAALAVNQQKEVQFNKDPRARRSNSRERNNRRHRSRSPERKSSRRSRSSSRDRCTDSDREGKDSSRRRTRFSAADDRSDAVMTTNNNRGAMGYSVPPPAKQITSPWEVAPPVISMLSTPQNFPNFNNSHSALPPTRHYQTENKSNNDSLGEIGTCVKVLNVDSETFYSDLRKFFAGLPIGQNDIKFVTDNKNNRTGVVLIRFLLSDSKKKALTKNMWQLKSTQVMIASITEDEFESGTLNSRGGNRSGNNNYRNDDRFRDRSNSRERDNNGRNFNRNDGNNRNNNRFDDRQQNNNRGGNFRGRDNNNRDFGNFRNDEHQEKPIEFKPDAEFCVLIIDDIPKTANEPDICEAFPNIVSIAIDRNKAFVKFTSHENAKVTLENRFIHYIHNKRVFLEAGSEAQFKDVARKFGKTDNPEHAVKDETNDSFNGEQINEDTSQSNHSNSSRNREQRPFESRDPRQRNFSNDRFGGNGNGNGNQMQTDCVIMKNMDTSTTIEDVEAFYKDLGIYKMRVHILLDKRSQPCGDCFVEFKFPNDSQRAIQKNNQLLKDRRVQVMMIPREQVEAVLSSFGDRDMPSKSQNRPSRPNDWAPPSDFGQPGCVLMLSNLCYKATVDDLLEEFREFELRPDQIIRRFNDMNQPTGNACINFNSPQDADMAIEKYNSVKIMNRPVWMKRV